VQIRTRWRGDANERPQKSGVREKQRGGKIAVGHQFARAIDIFEQKIEQLCPLNDTRLDETPLFGCDQERNRIDRQRPAYALGIGVDIVGDTVFPDPPFGALPATRQFVGTDGLDLLNELSPMWPRRDSVRCQFVIYRPVGQR
jgi:hypothetical protein